VVPVTEVLLNPEKASVGVAGAVVSTLMSGLVYVVVLPTLSATMY
jgi:hypothetical protein